MSGTRGELTEEQVRQADAWTTEELEEFTESDAPAMERMLALAALGARYELEVAKHDLKHRENTIRDTFAVMCDDCEDKLGRATVAGQYHKYSQTSCRRCNGPAETCLSCGDENCLTGCPSDEWHPYCPVY